MSKLPSHHEIAIASIPVFSDDGHLDLVELEKLLALALRDAVVDEDEKRVLGNILTRAERDGPGRGFSFPGRGRRCSARTVRRTLHVSN